MSRLENGSFLQLKPDFYPPKDQGSAPGKSVVIYKRPVETRLQKSTSPPTISIDRKTCEVTINERRSKLAPTEFDLFSILYSNAPNAVDNLTITRALLGKPSYIKTCIWHLRQKIEPDPTHPVFVINVRGFGYRFTNAEKPPNRLTSGDVSLDLETRQVFISDREITLSRLEYDLLKYFLGHPHKLLSHKEFGENIWYPLKKSFSSNSIKMCIFSLRRKIEPRAPRSKYIHVIYGCGYIFEKQRTGKKRSVDQTSNTLDCGYFFVDLEHHQIIRNNQRIHLTPTEFGLLQRFIQHPNVLLFYNDLINVWKGARNADKLNSLKNAIYSLRRKIGDRRGDPQIIVSEWGEGYMFVRDK